MAHQQVTYAPTALAGITADTRYFIRNEGGADIKVALGTTAPDSRTKDAVTVPQGGDIYPKPSSGESIYVWARVSFSDVYYEEAE